MVPNGNTPTHDEIHRHLELIERRAQLPVLVGLAGMTAYQRQRFVKDAIAFVVPDRQLFLPPLGLDMREHYAAEIRKPCDTLAPSTQAIFFAGLLGLWGMQHSSAIARDMGYSYMTLSRARKELEEHELLLPTYSNLGPKGKWQLTVTLREVLNNERRQHILRTPVVRRVWLTDKDDHLELPKAGLSALAAQTMLVEPAIPVFAIAESHFKALKNRRTEIHSESLHGGIELELWSYNPRAIMRDDQESVDTLSLYMSLREMVHKDERIAQASNQLLRELRS
jgi:hypothetical protein